MTAGSEKRVRVLVVDDDEKSGHFVADFLRREGFRAGVVGDGQTAVRVILSEKPEVVILDVTLPGFNGFDVCRKVRSNYGGFIVLLTEAKEEVDEALGLELGADDYMTKPVRPRVLLGRIRAFLRRPVAGTVSVLTVGNLRIDALQRRASRGDQVLDLTTSEFELLLFLAERGGKPADRDELYRGLRGIEYDGLDRSLDLCVTRLRRKLGEDGKHPECIKSVRGVGYQLVAGEPDA